MGDTQNIGDLVMTDQQLIDIAQAPMIAFNQRDWAGLKSCTTADFVYDEVATHRKLEGSDQVTKMWKEWVIALPDCHGTFVNAFVSGGKVVCDEWIMRATHTGPMQTPDKVIPATGKRVEVRTCRIIEFEGDKVRSIREYFDLMTMMQQLGLAG